MGLTHYTQPELLDILEMDPTTDGSVRLAQQYIVTLLNLEANAPNGSRCLPSDVETALLDAGDFLGRMADADLRIPYGLAPSAGAYLADRLADFNEGRTDAPLCRGRPGSP